MGQNGRLVAKYAGSSKLPKRISLIISGMNFGDMLDIAKWLRLRRKYPGRDLLLTTVCRTGTESWEMLPLRNPDHHVLNVIVILEFIVAFDEQGDTFGKVPVGLQFVECFCRIKHSCKGRTFNVFLHCLEITDVFAG